ncbi:hypothetical protein H2201_008049 [Coniosporium apollinis]|uniref:Uncharacterized protein n=1 Tax=Coniosporium apollinis TaxID=61459 RepID=A0ABQ9NHU8_9PEZI|nr:hypothetical protein H2201_008049 [Coniosporium apollinis]
MFWIAWWSTLTDILPQKQRFWNGEGWRSRGVTARTIGKKDPTATDNREVRDDLRQGSAADGDRKKTDDQEPSDKIGRGFRLNETAIRSGMEFFLGGGGIALIEDVFGVEESEDYDSGAGDGYDEESDGDSE